jgi:hypothetical protein
MEAQCTLITLDRAPAKEEICLGSGCKIIDDFKLIGDDVIRALQDAGINTPPLHYWDSNSGACGDAGCNCTNSNANANSNTDNSSDTVTNNSTDNNTDTVTDTTIAPTKVGLENNCTPENGGSPDPTDLSKCICPPKWTSGDKCEIYHSNAEGCCIGEEGGRMDIARGVNGDKVIQATILCRAPLDGSFHRFIAVRGNKPLLEDLANLHGNVHGTGHVDACDTITEALNKELPGANVKCSEEERQAVLNFEIQTACEGMECYTEEDVIFDNMEDCEKSIKELAVHKPIAVTGLKCSEEGSEIRWRAENQADCGVAANSMNAFDAVARAKEAKQIKNLFVFNCVLVPITFAIYYCFFQEEEEGAYFNLPKHLYSGVAFDAASAIFGMMGAIAWCFVSVRGVRFSVSSKMGVENQGDKENIPAEMFQRVAILFTLLTIGFTFYNLYQIAKYPLVDKVTKIWTSRKYKYTLVHTFLVEIPMTILYPIYIASVGFTPSLDFFGYLSFAYNLFSSIYTHCYGIYKYKCKQSTGTGQNIVQNFGFEQQPSAKGAAGASASVKKGSAKGAAAGTNPAKKKSSTKKKAATSN